MTIPADAGTRPVLVYDGDCGFCRYWVDYWRRLTGERVDYRPYQQAAADFADVSPREFAQSIYLCWPDGRRLRGAAAAFAVLALCPGRGLPAWCYCHLPGFAAVAEAAYRVVARHRVGAAHVSRCLWGPVREPATHDLVAWLFLRGLGLVYLAAFASFSVQAPGLIGADGVLPLAGFFDAVHAQLGRAGWWPLPSLFWFTQADWAISASGPLGVLLALCLVLRIAERAVLVLLYALYLSVVHAGQDFFMFQWDLLLLETGFLAIFLPGAPTVVIWLFRWLCFRYLFLAGITKLLSGDASWWALTALQYHFETQPLPSPLAWHAARLPEVLLAAGTAATLVIELVLPFLIFLPRRPRFFAAASVLLFQLLIVLTGSFNFFNLLTMLLCLFLFDDAALRRILPRRLSAAAPPPARARSLGLSLLALVLVTASLAQGYEQMRREPAWRPLSLLRQALSPLCIVNGYGLFAQMTKSRPEIVIEGSADGRTWRAYEFRYKPGDPARMPGWNVPHQPRLDWQMWFAALGSAPEHPWFANLLVRLLQGSPTVLALLASNPFPDHPPARVRAVLHAYRYTTPEERAATGDWWVRRELGLYFPPLGLDARGR